MANRVQHELMPTPDTATLRSRYGVEFTPPTSHVLASFDAACEQLIFEDEYLRKKHSDLGATSTKPVVIYEPGVFLRQPLLASQRAAINDQETPGVAAYCLGIQAQLAQVPIVESGEPLLHLPAFFAKHDVPASFSRTPFHEACGEWAGQPREFWTRKGFAERLLHMGRLVGSIGLQLHVEDAFRPVGVQEGLFKRRIGWTQADHPEWSEAQVIAEAQSKTAVTPRLASHKGGAAIDARLKVAHTGALLDIGHDYPEGGAIVFPRTPFVTANQWRNRQLFELAAGLSDLTLYVGEDWHVSFGDNLASLDQNNTVTPGYTAKYGPIKDFDRETGAITAVYTPEEMNTTFATR